MFDELFLVFYDITGSIVQMEIAYTMGEYYQWLRLAMMHDFETLPVTEDTFDKILQHPRSYRIVNGKLKYTVEHAVF
jgi:hypothetical protein